MTSPPVPKNFPARNRIISGLSLGILLVEAAERSGALITARMCNEDHNRELMAIPGPVDSATSAGCHKAIREGWATLVTNITDILDALRETGGELQKAGIVAAPADSQPDPDLFASLQSPAQQKILAALHSPQTLDQLAVATTLPIGALQSDLMMLQIRGMLRKEGPVFVRRS
jgi:DNA processing protein